jgi:plastocyanin
LTRAGSAGDRIGVRRLVLLSVLPLVLGLAPGAHGDPPLLIGTVGPGFTIDLTDANGNHVNVLTAGTYTLLVHDLADVHNFVLGSKTTGERLASTEVPFVGDETFTIELTPGRYAYACSPHFQIMNGSFVVVPAAPPPPTVGKLTATVTTRGVSLSTRGVKAGAFRLTVSDRSRTRNFHLAGPGVNRKTGAAFVGKVTWDLDLAPGTYRFGSDPRLSGRLVVG